MRFIHVLYFTLKNILKSFHPSFENHVVKINLRNLSNFLPLNINLINLIQNYPHIIESSQQTFVGLQDVSRVTIFHLSRSPQDVIKTS